MSSAATPVQAAAAVPAGTVAMPEGGEAGGVGGAWSLVFHAFAENRLALAGVALIALIALFCFLGPLVYHTDQLHTNLFATNEAPSGAHPLGTDELGFDILGRLMVGGQSALEVGLAVALCATGIGVVYGTIAGYLGGLIDAVMMRIVDVILAIPTIFLFIFLATIFRPTLVLLILVLSSLSWLTTARLVRAEALALRPREFVEAVRLVGGRAPRIIGRHLVPNSIGTIVVNATFQVADAILVLAVLTFLGFALPPPAVTWGGMLSDGTNFLYDGYWWQVYPALVMIVLTVVAFNFVGDGLRDSLDVRLRRR
ncbi:MAG TPA: ABC transporter permease [Acidimicrobiales bacterium]|nr:ABC transporter permease [Acidimicrobiales bacterium]